MNKFPFENCIKQLVLRLNSLIHNAEHFSSHGEEPATSESAGYIFSCQIVNFGSEGGKLNNYDVYNYCHTLDVYEEKLQQHFNDAEKNKSIISIEKVNDDGIWYSYKRDEKQTQIHGIDLKYRQRSTVASYEVYNGEAECMKQWENWKELMFSIYEKACSVFSKNIRIKLTDKNYLYSGIYITFSCELNYKQIGIIGRICETTLNEIAFKDLIPNLHQNIERQATKSAISQVMARNSSHNIGSHVMNKLTGDLSKIDLFSFDKYRSTAFEELYKEKFDKLYISLDLEAKRTALKTELLLDQLAIFNNYVKCRMDYLSDITFGTPLMQTTKRVYGELFKELDKVRLLLEYISGLSNFHYQIQFTNNGVQLKEEDVLSVALPNDILGCQALYNIIENVIRNTAKHSIGKEEVVCDANREKTIIFTINIKEIETTSAKVDCAEYYQVEIFDNVPVEGGRQFESADETNEKKKYVEDLNKDNETQISEGTSVSNIEYLVYSQNKKLNESILQDNNSLRASALGLIEMEASACYLRKLDISNIESDDYNIDYDGSIYTKTSNNLNIVKAFKAGENKNNLGYRFFMLRPAEVLVVTDNGLNGVNTNDWLKKGVKIIGVGDFITSLEKGKVYNHQFLVFDNDKTLETIKETEEKEIDSVKVQLSKYTTSLPLRIVKITDVNTFFKNNFDEMELMLWNEWEKVFNAPKTIFYIANDEQPEREGFTPFVFFNHVGVDQPQVIKKRIQGILEDENKTGYYEALSSKAQSALPNFNFLSQPNGADDKPIDIYLSKVECPKKVESKKIFESCLSRIVVIDERVQSVLDDTYMEVPFKQLYKKSNIFIPEYNRKTKTEECIDLAALNYDEVLINKLKSYINCQVSKKCDFIIFHYSILERMFAKSEQEELIIAINNYLDILSTKVNVIITSGRGTPKQLTKSVRYVNLSPILSALVEVRSKYLINSLLHSSRKTYII
jgi:hypothetical protein